MATPADSSPARFLVAFDFSRTAEAHVAYAVRLANALGAQCTVLHAVPPPETAVVGAVDLIDAPRATDVGEVRQSLTTFVEGLSADRPVQVEVTTGSSPVAAVLEGAERLDADLVVLPSHGRSGLSRLVLGSTAEQIMRRSTRPVLLLTDRMLDNESDPTTAKRPVVLATDLSETARFAHQPAAELARRLGLPLQALSVVSTVEPLPYAPGAPVSPPQPDAAALIEHWEDQLRRATRGPGGGTDPDIRVLMDDDVATTIVDSAAAANAFLLVLATHGRRGIERMIQGSIAEQITRNSTVPVICMPARTV